MRCAGFDGRCVTRSVLFTKQEWEDLDIAITKHNLAETKHIGATLGLVLVRVFKDGGRDSVAMRMVAASAIESYLNRQSMEGGALWGLAGWWERMRMELTLCCCLWNGAPKLAWQGEEASPGEADGGDAEAPDAQREANTHENAAEGVQPDGVEIVLARAEAGLEDVRNRRNYAPLLAICDVPRAPLRRTDSSFVDDELELPSPQEVAAPPGLYVEFPVLAASSAGPLHGCQFRAVRTGPIGPVVQVWCDDIQTFDLAVDERYTKPHVGVHVKFTHMDRRKIGAVNQYLMANIFTRDAVKRWAEDKPDVKSRAAKKWNVDRIDRAARDAAVKGMPAASGSVKCEVLVLRPGKDRRPRPIVADGDLGAICAADACGAIEGCLFAHGAYEDASIKHVDKAKAMDRVAEKLRLSEGAVINEQDGSAWDGCCGAEVRDACENVIMRHILCELVCAQNAGSVDDTLNSAHYRRCATKVLQVRYNKVEGPGERREFPAIRRTGHKGTSVLNYLINLVLTACAIARNPEEAVALVASWRENTGNVRAFFEGDDGIFCGPSKWWTAQREREFLDFWTRAGFIMKIVTSREGSLAAEFCGWKFGTDKYGIMEEERSPDIKRCLGHASWQHGPELMAAYRAGDMQKVRSLAAGCYISYARLFAGRCTPLTNYFLLLAETLSDEAEFSEDQLRRWRASTKEVIADARAQPHRVPTRMLVQLGISWPDDIEEKLVLAASLGVRGRLPAEFC